MPIFEYVCGECDKQFEELVIGTKDTPLCPDCGSAETRKMMSCCRTRSGSRADASPSGGSGCAGCGGGSCATCG